MTENYNHVQYGIPRTRVLGEGYPIEKVLREGADYIEGLRLKDTSSTAHEITSVQFFRGYHGTAIDIGWTRVRRETDCCAGIWDARRRRERAMLS